MKFLTLCVVLVAGIHAEFVSPFPEEFDKIVDACRKETGYTDEVFAKEKESYFSENRGLRIFNYCFLEKTGFVTSDGKLNIDEALAKYNTSSIRDLVEDCNDRETFNPPRIFSRCFHSGVSTIMRLKEIKGTTSSQLENITQIVNACRNETNYTDEVIAEEEKSDLNKEERLKKFNNCFLEKTGFRDNDKYDIDDVLPDLPQRYVTHMNAFCELKILQKKIPDSIPFLSACLHLGVSGYIRSNFEHIVPLPESDHVTQIIDVCRKETGFTDQILHKEKKGNFTEETGLRKFNNCFLQKTGVITSDEKLNIDEALAKLPPSFTKSIIEHCQANIILKYTTDSVQDFSTCYLHGVQNHISRGFKDPFSVSLQLVIPGTSFEKGVFIL